MNKRFTEEQLYLPLIDQYASGRVDLKRISQSIIDACSATEVNCGKVEPGIAIRNTLMLALGLIHNESPIDVDGNDLWEIEKKEREKRIKELRSLF